MPISKILRNNRAWAQQRVKEDPEFFERLCNIQTPEFLWIGCSDSRVPANQITGTDPGQVFVHRNVANLIVHSDMNMLSVVQYAVEVLKVKHIIICGHYGCGGVKAALSNETFGLIDNWIRNIKDVYRLHSSELNAITDDAERFDRLIELNVMEQVLNLAKTSIIQDAWKRTGGQSPSINGLVYSLKDGFLKDLGNSASDHSILEKIYRFY